MPPANDFLPAIVARLAEPACYDHPVGPVRVIETHISFLLLTGEFAYKLKKPLDLGFLDFSTLEKRREACREEVRLNRRLAPELYLDVVPIAGTPDAPRVNGAGPAFEYAVKMRQFPAEATLDRLGVTAAQIERIAQTLARFHETACARADPAGPWGHPDAVWQPVAQNFAQITPHLTDAAAQAELEGLRRWSAAEHARLAPHMATRLAAGYVRECHGDLHLGNLAWADDRLLVFDCLEFNPGLRWIDIQSEIAFLYMDLRQRDEDALAWLFVNLWLEHTGDYAGMALLRYYAVYRALVRAKVAAIRASQTQGDARAAALDGVHALLALATRLTQPLPLELAITHGLSGSGKTTVTRARMQAPGAIRLRSDVERKRLAGLDALARSGAGVASGLYGGDATRRTYEHLAGLAAGLLEADWPVIVDATFIARWQRDLLRDTAHAHGARFCILDFPEPVDTLRARIVARSRQGTDASEADLAVLEHQLQTQEPLADDERVATVDARG